MVCRGTDIFDFHLLLVNILIFYFILEMIFIYLIFPDYLLLERN